MDSYPFTQSLGNNLLIVESISKTGDSLIDIDENVAIPLSKYENILLEYRNQYAHIKRSGKWGLMDSTRKKVILPQYDNPLVFTLEGLAHVKLDEKWTFINRVGIEIHK